MRIYILFILVVFSCKQENKCELALSEYVKEDLFFKQSRIDYQLNILRIKSLERKKQYEFVYKEAESINRLCLNFEKNVLTNDNESFINEQYKLLKDSLVKKEYLKKDFIVDEFNKLPTKINNTLEKYNLLRKLKEFNFRNTELILSYSLITKLYCGGPIITPTVLATRLNKEEVLLNIYCGYTKEFLPDFDSRSFELIKLEDSNKNNITYVRRGDQNLLRSYVLHTKSDTIYFDGLIKTKESIGLLIAENKSFIIVGKPKPFDNDLLKDYLLHKNTDD